MDFYLRALITVLRYVIPALSVVTVSFCAKNLLIKKKPYYKAMIVPEKGKAKQIKSAELLIGSDKKCDFVIPSADEKHATLSYADNGYTLTPLDGNEISVNLKPYDSAVRVASDDRITVGETTFSIRLKKNNSKSKFGDGDFIIPFFSLVLIQLFLLAELIIYKPDNSFYYSVAFAALIVSESVYFIVRRNIGDKGIEILALFLVSVGLSVTGRVDCNSMFKQEACFFAGCICGFLIELIIKNTKIAAALKIPAALTGLALFAVNIFFGVAYNGSKNWIEIGSVQFQPSELAKVVLVFISAATLDKMVSGKSLVGFTSFSVISMMILAYLRDFGTAIIYFTVFLVVLFLRLCNLKIIIGILLSASAFGFAAVKFIPYVNERFASFGHAWEHAADSGYQQTRTMIAVASGGLFGTGTGNGYLIHVAAADTDIVFGLVAEELGLIVALSVALCFIVFVLYAAKTFTFSATLYNSISCSAAATVFIAQASLNIFGSLDMLPFTGVTLPFVSNGGTSVLSCAMMLAFFKAASRKRTLIRSSDETEVQV